MSTPGDQPGHGPAAPAAEDDGQDVTVGELDKALEEMGGLGDTDVDVDDSSEDVTAGHQIGHPTIPKLRIRRPASRNGGGGGGGASGSSSSLDGGEGESVDPRVQTVLEEMTDAMDEVNKAENLLTSAKKAYRDAIINGTERMQAALRRPGVRSAVEKAEPYYMALQTLTKGREEAETLARAYEAGQRLLELARDEELACERALVAELQSNGLLAATHASRVDGDPVMLTAATQDAINAATDKVNASKREIERIGRKSAAIAQKVMRARERFGQYEEKARFDPIFATRVEQAAPYYEVKSAVEREIASAQKRVDLLSAHVQAARAKYRTATHNVGTLSLAIHSARGTPTARSPATSADDIAGSPAHRHRTMRTSAPS